MTNDPNPPRLDVAAVNTGAAAEGPVQLYAAREKIHPKRAEGDFRRFKWIVMFVTLGIYYVTPWLRWNRGEFAPDQAVLIDMANRRFYFFFVEIWPQEFPYVAGLLVMAGVGLFLVTSVVGRAWCGYTCPQTVWTDLFLVVERAIEGDRNARIRLDRAPLSAGKLTKRVSKHLIWLLIAVATGGAWIFYFADAPTLFGQFVTGQAAFVAYATVAVLTATTYVFGGLMREQVCIYMCPWPRIQAAMTDADTLIVTYNDWRGEPRTRGRKRAAGLTVAGDCIDCNACVAVCPTGIDIRDGQQLECISCALCIDACDGMMDKVGRPRGLISYATLRDYNHNMALATDPETGALNPDRVRDGAGGYIQKIRHIGAGILIRPRTLIYFGIWAAIGVGMVVALGLRDRLEINVQHDRNPLFVALSDGSIRNGYTVKLLNMIPEPRVVELSVDGLAGAVMTSPDLGLSPAPRVAIQLQPDQVRSLRVFVQQPPWFLAPGNEDFQLIVRDPASGEVDIYDATFNRRDAGP
ncbi:cytochrome c oxidase accessory protein CcoG [Pontivivens insulae]|uniref:4Fe-4S ferredoxin-type domain-containing protein n=1 Tax=Pontivivens insulae TaxID=1639689 RepID=A0A2R8AFW4_9RHOB|nr:cytochrome c oxidase accessory protein CcoG [Pontivivens insulae]RED12231.1 cytochrome c oxidase accessory protein FixG [Pontivivens insulae]SPF30988.1 hypothetical protein POI8812_03335 [Pontivivens insulae]